MRGTLNGSVPKLAHEVTRRVPVGVPKHRRAARVPTGRVKYDRYRDSSRTILQDDLARASRDSRHPRRGKLRQRSGRLRQELLEAKKQETRDRRVARSSQRFIRLPRGAHGSLRVTDGAFRAAFSGDLFLLHLGAFLPPRRVRSRSLAVRSTRASYALQSPMSSFTISHRVVTRFERAMSRRSSSRRDHGTISSTPVLVPHHRRPRLTVLERLSLTGELLLSRTSPHRMAW